MDIEELRKVGTCVFLAAEKEVAEDVAKHIMDAADEIERLWAVNDRLRALLKRYRTETPLGHQPHMIAQHVDAALGLNETTVTEKKP